jgi:hypothetical protein
MKQWCHDTSVSDPNSIRSVDSDLVSGTETKNFFMHFMFGEAAFLSGVPVAFAS